MPLINSKREAAIAIMLAQLNDPYVWAGNAKLQDGGVDCSGAVNFALREVGITNADHTSYELADMFPAVNALKEGVLLFWRRGSGIRHVEMVLGYMDGEWWTIGAAGGDSSTDTLEEAQARDARVKIHPAPKDWVKAVDPFSS